MAFNLNVLVFKVNRFGDVKRRECPLSGRYERRRCQGERLKMEIKIM